MFQNMGRYWLPRGSLLAGCTSKPKWIWPTICKSCSVQVQISKAKQNPGHVPETKFRIFFELIQSIAAIEALYARKRGEWSRSIGHAHNADSICAPTSSSEWFTNIQDCLIGMTTTPSSYEKPMHSSLSHWSKYQLQDSTESRTSSRSPPTFPTVRLASCQTRGRWGRKIEAESSRDKRMRRWRLGWFNCT